MRARERNAFPSLLCFLSLSLSSTTAPSPPLLPNSLTGCAPAPSGSPHEEATRRSPIAAAMRRWRRGSGLDRCGKLLMPPPPPPVVAAAAAAAEAAAAASLPQPGLDRRSKPALPGSSSAGGSYGGSCCCCCGGGGGAWPGPSSVGLWPKPNSGLGLARLEMKHAHSSNRQLHPVMIVKACGSKIAHPSSQRLPDPPWGANLARGRTSSLFAIGSAWGAGLVPSPASLDELWLISTVTLKVLAAWPLAGHSGGA